MEILFVSSRSVTLQISHEGDYTMPSPLALFVNDSFLRMENCCITSLFDLQPSTSYTVTLHSSEDPSSSVISELGFTTSPESFSLDVIRFGARGDGIHDDTAAIQAAILSCPEGGRVVVPQGVYNVSPLFLKSHITLELKRNATLSLTINEDRFPVLPGVTFATEGDQEMLLGSWEGNPLDSYASAITGISVFDVRLIGEGIIDGNGQSGTWWIHPKERKAPFRGNLFMLKDCRDIVVQGITFRNSPSWNVHPMFSENLLFLNIHVEAPAVSPNTDGFDPESCRHIRLLGTTFSVGDDCIALKAGKIYMGMKYHTPCEDIEIAHCAMLAGHGGVTVGSEMAGGVKHVWVHHCSMHGNDRGLRIKTRRGRGKYAVVDDIRFEDIRMEGVKTPLVVNALYSCDPDGHTEYVQSLEPQPVTDGTPTLGTISFERVHAVGCHGAVAYILGLPERPLRKLVIRDCDFTFADPAIPMQPAMADCVEDIAGAGILTSSVDELVIENVNVQGLNGPLHQAL